MSRILTLNIGASKVVLAEYALSGKRNLSLTAYGQAELVGVDVNAPETLEAALPSVLRQIMREQGIKPGPLVVSLSGQMVFPRFAKLAPVTGDKLEQSIRFEIEQNVPFPIEEIVSDHQVLGELPDGDLGALIVAAKLDAVRAVTNGVKAAGLKPAIVDVSPMAVCNAARFLRPQQAGCTVILDIGSKTTGLAILEDNKIYNRSINVAGNAITKEIAQTFGCSQDEADQLKQTSGYVSMGGVTEDADETTDRLSKVIRMVLTRLHAEISRSINFYRSQQGGSAPARLLLTGGTSRLPQLAEFFAETLQVEVDFLNPFEKIAYGSKVNSGALENDAFVLAESLGLALRQTDAATIAINLMPPELISEAQAIRRIPFLVVGGVSLLAALGTGLFMESHATDVAKAQSDVVEQCNNSLKALEATLKASQKAVEEECEKCDDFQRLLWSRSAALLQVRAVRASLIPGMWITEWAVVPKKDENAKAEQVRVTVRGWRDAMAKAETAWSSKNGGKKATAAEIVQASLKGKSAIVGETVKIVAQKDVKDCLVEFAIQMEFAQAPSAIPEEGRKGKAKE